MSDFSKAQVLVILELVPEETKMYLFHREDEIIRQLTPHHADVLGEDNLEPGAAEQMEAAIQLLLDRRALHELQILKLPITPLSGVIHLTQLL